MASGIATITFHARLNSGGDRNVVDDSFVLSGLRVLAGPGQAYLSANSASLDIMATSNIYGIWLMNASGKSTGAPALYAYASGHTVAAKASAILKVNEGEWAFWRPVSAIETIKLWTSTCGLTYRYLMLGQ